MSFARHIGARPDARFAALGGDFYTAMGAEKIGTPRLIHANEAAAALIDLDSAAFHDPDFARVFSGHMPLPGAEALAMVYSGHQFGVWAGQLGDGRALLIGQLRNARGELWDVQLKGAGKTPYSRFGDGRAVMRSSIREYLCSEAMAALGIPTSRALALMATGETVLRETPEPGAVLTRLARSHIRFGHFEHFHHRGQTDQVRLLADHVIGEYFPGLDHAQWFEEVVRRTAHLMAAWQAAGFAHGVMNTDNMSILGLTLDYGPFGFLDAYDPHFICNHTDEQGRYSFINQPGIGHWNLRALAQALTSLIGVDILVAALNRYEEFFAAAYRAAMRAKLGFTREEDDDDMLIGDLLALMVASRADYTSTFHDLSSVGALPGGEAWTVRYLTRLNGETPPRNPKYVLRNWVAETAIRAVEDRGDAAMLDRILKMLQSPFDDQPENDAFAAPPPPELCGLEVSCSS